MPKSAPRSRLRVLHCPELWGGIPITIARAEREIGLESIAASFVPTRYGDEPDVVIFRGHPHRLRAEGQRWGFLLRAARQFDVFHFNAGSSLMPTYERRENTDVRQAAFDRYARLVELKDVAWLRSLGKAVFVTEYELDTSAFCSKAQAAGFMAMRKHFELDAWREPCW